MGERAPHLDPEARATLTGLQAHHRRGHIIRAIMEGVAFSLKDTFTILGELGVPVQAIRLGGGGARSPLWRQIQADVYGQAIEIVEAEEGAAYGGALLAGVGTGVWPSVDDACREVVRIRQRIEPHEASKLTLEHRYQQYRAIYPALAALFHSEK
jgi:xylulokinase